MKARTQPTEAKDSSAANRSALRGNNLPLFARSLNTSKFPALESASGASASVWSRRGAVGLAVLTCGILLAQARPNSAQNLPVSHSNTPANRQPGGARATRSANTRNTLVAQARPAPSANAPTVEPQTDATEERRRPLNFYTQTVRGNMFNAPIPPAPKPAPVVVVPKPPVIKPAKAPIIVLPEINPFADWSYTGTITMGDQTIALLENTKTKDGQYVKPGDTFLNAQISSITSQMVTIQSGNKPHTLAKSDNITVTPLDRSAIPANGGQNPQPPQPAQPQQQAQSFNGPMNNWRGNMGDQTFTLPNGRQMNAQRFQRRSQQMNNNFNQ